MKAVRDDRRASSATGANACLHRTSRDEGGVRRNGLLRFDPRCAHSRPPESHSLGSDVSAVWLAGAWQRLLPRRVAIAVRPDLLVCDEPVASLDVSVQAQILELLREIRRTRGTSMLFITHDLAVVRQMAERVVVLHDGEIVEEGETDAVLDRPAHAYTKRLLDSVVS